MKKKHYRPKKSPIIWSIRPQHACFFNKGFIFTLDAILSVIVMSLLLTLIVLLSSQQPVDYSASDLHLIAMDTLTVLEKDRTLQNSIAANNTGAILTYLDALPSRLCANISVFTQASTLQYSVAKTNCTATGEHAVARRVFLNSNDMIFLAKIDLWLARR